MPLLLFRKIRSRVLAADDQDGSPIVCPVDLETGRPVTLLESQNAKHKMKKLLLNLRLRHTAFAVLYL